MDAKVVIIALVVLLIIGSFIVWTRTNAAKSLSFNLFGLLKANAEQETAQQPKERDYDMTQTRGESNEMRAKIGGSAKMLQDDGKNNKMTVE